MFLRLGGLLPAIIGTLALAQTSHAGVFDFFANSKYPNNKGLSIVDAANAALWAHARGKPYLDVVEEKTRLLNSKGGVVGSLIPSEQCAISELQKSNGEGINCVPVKPSTEGCNSDECIGVILPSGLLEDASYRKVLNQAIESPCQSITNPESIKAIYNHKYHNIYGMRYVTEFSWNFLRCDSRNPVKGEVVNENGNTLFVKIK